MGIPRHRQTDELRAKPLRAEHPTVNEVAGSGDGKKITEVSAENRPGLQTVRADRSGGRELALARATVARAFHETLVEYFDFWRSENRGDESYSNRALARRLLNVDEKQIREWRDGRKPIPLAVVLLLPPAFVEKLLARIGADREAFVRELRALEGK